MRVAYLFTTFPKPSEKFLHRELTGMEKQRELDISIYSLFGGHGDNFREFPVTHFSWKDYLLFPIRFFVEGFNHPRTYRRLAALYLKNPPRSFTNFLENLVGVMFAISYAEKFRERPADIVHAVWATAPAAAALVLKHLTGARFSMGAHAYDIHRNGGDCLLLEKTLEAEFVHTSTDDARKSLITKGVDASKIKLIRRGLDSIPKIEPASEWPEKLRLLSVGRLIEKKGYFEQLQIYANLRSAGISLEARIIGGGPLRSQLQAEIDALGLQNEVTLCGPMDYEDVQTHYSDWADAFVFTGKIARSGDRDGFPNVVGEAMAAGLVILATSVAGIPEAIHNGKTGYILPIDEPESWSERLQQLQSNHAERDRVRMNAHQWIENNFDQSTNSAAIADEWRAALTVSTKQS